MYYPFSANRVTNNASSNTSNPFKTQFRDHIIDAKETVSLLEAPPITRNAQWKLRSFMYYKAKLCPKIITHSADSLILVIGQHFEVNTHVATAQAESYAEKIRNHSEMRIIYPH